MAVLTSQLERDETFARRAERMETLVAELRERTALVARGGGEKAVERHRSRGKLTARADRPASRSRHRLPRAERARGLGPLLTAPRRRPGSSPGSRDRGPGVRRRRQRRDRQGRLLLPLTVKKHLRAQGGQNHSCVSSSTRAGPSCPLQAEVFPTASTSDASSTTRHACPRRGSPDRGRDGVVHGRRRVRAGDERRDGDRARHRDDLHRRPAAREGGEGQDVTAEELGGADVHTPLRGRRPLRRLEHALALARQIVRNLHGARSCPWDVAPPTAALDPDDLYGLVPEDFKHEMDAHELIARSSTAAASPSSRRSTARRSSAVRPDRGLPGRHPRQQGRPLRRVGPEGRPLHRARREAGCRSSSCRTSPASWSARSTRRAGSRATAPSSSRRSPARTCPSSPSSREARSGRATTRCAVAPTGRDSSGCGRTRISVMGGEQAATVLTDGRGRGPDAMRDVRGGEESVLLDGAWDDGIIDPRDTARARPRHLRSAECTRPREHVRHLSDVRRVRWHHR